MLKTILKIIAVLSLVYFIIVNRKIIAIAIFMISMIFADYNDKRNGRRWWEW